MVCGLYIKYYHIKKDTDETKVAWKRRGKNILTNEAEIDYDYVEECLSHRFVWMSLDWMMCEGVFFFNNSMFDLFLLVCLDCGCLYGKVYLWRYFDWCTSCFDRWTSSYLGSYSRAQVTQKEKRNFLNANLVQNQRYDVECMKKRQKYFNFSTISFTLRTKYWHMLHNRSYRTHTNTNPCLQ